MAEETIYENYGGGWSTARRGLTGIGTDAGATDQKNKAIILRIDKDVKYERVIIILDLLQKNSLNNLALVTNNKK